MTKWLPSILPLLAAIGVQLAPLAQQLIASHPRISMALALTYAIIAHLTPSPLQTPKGN